ncbi:hypothetical protein, partial [Pseudomonas ficuserectae]
FRPSLNASGSSVRNLNRNHLPLSVNYSVFKLYQQSRKKHMTNFFYLVNPNDIRIDRKSSPRTATVRGAGGEPVLTVPASLPDQEIMNLADTFNLVYAQGFELTKRQEG